MTQPPPPTPEPIDHGSTAADKPVHQPEEIHQSVWKVILAGCVGIFVELYDNGIFAFMATALAIVFFNVESSSQALMLVFAGYAVSFFVRPLGAVVCGYLGDRIGRQKMLVFVIMLISVATAGIGMLPSYAAIGVAAPVLLVLLRIMQGFSVGGEAAGAMTFLAEHAPEGRRGFLTSLAQVASFVALLTGTLVAYAMSPWLTAEAINGGGWGSFAWRVPFLVAIPMGFIGYYIRKAIEDTPNFTKLKEEGGLAKNPLKEAFAIPEHRKALFFALTIPLMNQSGYYILFSYMPTFLHSQTIGFSTGTALLVTGASLVFITNRDPVHGLAVRPAGSQEGHRGRRGGHGGRRDPLLRPDRDQQLLARGAGRVHHGRDLRGPHRRDPHPHRGALPDPRAVLGLWSRLQHLLGPVRRHRAAAHDLGDPALRHLLPGLVRGLHLRGDVLRRAPHQGPGARAAARCPRAGRLTRKETTLMLGTTYRTALVTGVSTGMGEAIARRLAGHGVQVTGIARNKAKLDALASEIGITPIALELSDTDALEAAVAGLDVDILVNNAGVSANGNVLDATREAIDSMVDVNLRALLHLCRLLVPGMAERNRGHIVNIGSIAGLYNFFGHTAYHATKAAVHQISRQLRNDLLGKKVRVTELVPGRVETEIFGRNMGGTEEDLKKAWDTFYAHYESVTTTDITDAAEFALQRPENVNIGMIEIVPTLQVPGGLQFFESR